MPTFISPAGNAEVWEEKPKGYLTAEEWQVAHPSPCIIPTSDQQFFALRAERDARLASTDKMLLPDYPISADDLAQVKAYRAALRDLPDQPGAPWDGGGDETPWPELPQI